MSDRQVRDDTLDAARWRRVRQEPWWMLGEHHEGRNRNPTPEQMDTLIDKVIAFRAEEDAELEARDE